MKELIFALSGFAGGVVVSYLYGKKFLADVKLGLLGHVTEAVLFAENIPSAAKKEVLDLIGKL